MKCFKQFENETNMKSKSIFKNLSKKKVEEENPEVRKISTINLFKKMI